ncbi:hypothetical protein M434DRAFT_38301 [Hypoxylon sp. CO27-5]|nr:hypothetical protein M434DRAFT_38301 [Hypoxylon sp. CO27-5]
MPPELNRIHHTRLPPLDDLGTFDEHHKPSDSSIGKRRLISFDNFSIMRNGIPQKDDSSGTLVMINEGNTTYHQTSDVDLNQSALGLMRDAPKIGPNVADTLNYCCRTEPDSTAAINLGFKNTIYRWTPQSTITYNVNKFFPKSKLAHAMKCLNEAAVEWNKANIGVQFKRVPDNTPAVFQLAYATGNRGWLACAFFPNAKLEDRQLYICERAFEQLYSPWMANIFSHELGHILGLRHDFAPEREKHYPCVVWGSRNLSSVMNYFDHDMSQMRLQETDHDELRQFYDYREEQYRSFTIIDVDPVCQDTLSSSPSATLLFRLRNGKRKLLEIMHLVHIN